MDKLQKMLPYLIINIITFYVLPLLGRNTGSFMLILLIIMPLICFFSSLLYGFKEGFQLIYPIIVAIIFIPTIFIYYNSSAWIYTLIYAGIAFIGNIFASNFICHKNSKN